MSTQMTQLIGVASLVAAAGFVNTASADSPVYADINGMCGGLTPCYLTIQEAVDSATDPDGFGPLFAEVFVFPGRYTESVNLNGLGGGVPGDVQMTTVDSTGAPAPGTVAIESGNGPAIGYVDAVLEGRVMIDGFVVTSKSSFGVAIGSKEDVIIRNVFAHDAGMNSLQDPNSVLGTGIAVFSLEGDVSVLDSTARNCRISGVYAESSEGNVTIDGVDAADNLRDGIEVRAELNAIARNSSASGNGRDGMLLRGKRETIIDQCAADRNDQHGFRAHAGPAMSVTSSTARENGSFGFYHISELGSVTLDRLTAEGNGASGVGVEAAEIIVTNSSSIRSADVGFTLIAVGNITLESLFARQSTRGYYLYTLGDVQVTNAATENARNHGFHIRAAGSVTMNRITSVDTMDGAGVYVEPRDPGGLVGRISIRNSLLTGNGLLPGIFLNGLAPDGSHVIAGSIICGNPAGGLVQSATSTAAIDARGNWWGDVTGPKRPNSAAGLGDGIEPGGGEIIVDPWIDRISAVASHETATLANDVTVQFQFRHSGSETFLGEGPGAVGARRPFIVTTNNGKLSSHDQTAADVSAFVVGDKGIVEVIAKGSAEGPAKIELSGLCFPARSVTIEVIPVPIPLPPNPTPTADANESSEPKRATPFCGAGVPMMAGLSAAGLFAIGRASGPRRPRRVG